MNPNEINSGTIHIGLDFWLPSKTPDHSIFDGEVVIATNDAGDKEYGGLVVLKHKAKDFNFYTLYGHNSVKSATIHSVGDKIKKGDKISEIGNYPENGNWPPHLHFQIMLSMMDFKIDFPGVMYFNQINIWKEICPDPNLFFKSKSLDLKQEISSHELINFRKKHLGKSLKLHYNDPIRIVRGAGQYLIDNTGRLYLDTVNNVAHVGHENSFIVTAGQKQMAVLNTNTRYLHESINTLAKKLLKTLPQELSVCYFVNSGSEANELALRMVKESTGQKDMIVSQWGYHGNTNKCIDISSYKFDRKGGKGAPKNTHVIPIPDSYKGKYRVQDQYLVAEGGRIGKQEGGLMNLGGMEKDYRNDGGFVPLGGEEKADDVPARLSRNEFVFTADAVRNAGAGDMDRGAEVMENVMKNLEGGGRISDESQGQGARDMFSVSERLSEVV